MSEETTLLRTCSFVIGEDKGRCAPATCSAVLADKIARDIMAVGSGPTPCKRIQFIGGQWPDAETCQGGLCESALAKCIAESLVRHLPNDRTQPPPG